MSLGCARASIALVPVKIKKIYSGFCFSVTKLYCHVSLAHILVISGIYVAMACA